jgi:hypothetical protein
LCDPNTEKVKNTNIYQNKIYYNTGRNTKWDVKEKVYKFQIEIEKAEKIRKISCAVSQIASKVIKAFISYMIQCYYLLLDASRQLLHKLMLIILKERKKQQ